MSKSFLLLFLLNFTFLCANSQEGTVGQNTNIPTETLHDNEKKDTLGTLSETTETVIQFDENSTLEKPNFDTDLIEKYKNDSAFDYSEDISEENWWTSFKRWAADVWNGFWEWLLGDYHANGFISFLVNTIPYLIIAGIMAFIVWLFFKLNPGARLLRSSEQPDVFFTEDEEIIKNKNIKKLINKALEKQEYRLAVRYYYLYILKSLSDAELIEYEFDKTNSDYFYEISDEQINQNFRKVTNLYDYIWYGSFEVTETEYLKAQKSFSDLENQIPQPNV